MAKKVKNKSPFVIGNDEETLAGLRRLNSLLADIQESTERQASPYRGGVLSHIDTDELNKSYLGRPIEFDTPEDYYDPSSDSTSSEWISDSTIDSIKDHIAGAVAGGAVGTGMFPGYGSAVGAVLGGLAGADRIKDVGRYLTQKASETILSSNIFERHDANRELENIKLIKDYKKAQSEIGGLRNTLLGNLGMSDDLASIEQLNSYAKQVANGTQFAAPGLKALCEQYVDHLNTINYLDNYFKKEGRQSPVISKEMYKDPQGAFDNTRLVLESMNRDMVKWTELDLNESFFGKLGDAAINVGNALLPLQYVKALKDAIDGNTTSSVIKILKDGDPLIDKLYKGSEYSKEDSTNIDKMLDNYNRFLKQNDIKIKADLEFYRSGILHPTVIAKTIGEYIPFVDSTLDESDLGAGTVAGFDLNKWKPYDPNQIDPTYKKEQQENNWKFWRPDYWIPEIGSTLGLGVGMMGSMSTNAVASYVMKRLPVWLESKGAALAADIAAATIMGTDVAASIGFSKKSREMETAGEAANGMATRIIESLSKDGAQYSETMKELSDVLKKDWKINTASLKPEEIIQLAIAYNVKTKDGLFNAEVSDARKGLGKLINANNSLAYIDYLETLPFLNYGGSLFRAVGNTLARGGSKIVGTRAYRLLTSKNAEEFAQNTTARNIIDYQTRRANTPMMLGGKEVFVPNPIGQYELLSVSKVLDDIAVPVVQKFKPEVTAVFDNIIERSAKKAIEKGLITRGLVNKHIGDFAKKGASRMLNIGINEGIEEGNQEILQSRYKRGEYDNYHEPYSIFNIPEALRDVELSTEAIADFFGINFGDPDNASSDVRRAMMVGFLASLGLPILGSAYSNIRGAEEGNIRGLVKQIHSDVRAGKVLNYDNETIKKLINEVKDNKVILKMVGDNLGGEQDDQRLGMFFDAFHKVGATSRTLGKSLRDYMDLIDKDDLVSKQFVKDDILLMNAAYAMYNSDWVKEQLKKDNLLKYGEEHKNIVKTGARFIVEAAKAQETLRDSEKFARGHRRQNYNDIVKLQDFDELIDALAKDTDESSNQKRADLIRQRLELLDNNKYLNSLYEFVKPFYDNSKSKLISNLNDSYESFINNEFIKNAIKGRQGEKGGLGYREFDDVAKEYFEDDEKRSMLINQAMSSSSLKNVYDTLAEFNTLYHDYQERLAAEKALQLLEDQDKLQSEFKKATGLDINTKKLKGLKKIIKAQIDSIKQNEYKYISENFGNVNTYEELFKDGNIELFNDNTEYEKQIIGLTINSAAYENLAVMRNAYMTGMSFAGLAFISPDADILETSAYGDEGNSIIAETVKQFKKLDEEYKTEVQGKHTSTKKHDLEELKKKAAWQVIKDNLNQNELHKRIAHRIFEEDRPIHSSDIDAAQNGDATAGQRITGENEQLQQGGQQLQQQSGNEFSWGGVQGDADLSANAMAESEASKMSRKQIEGADLAAEQARAAAEQMARELRAALNAAEQAQAAENAAAQHDAELNDKKKQELDEFERLAENDNKHLKELFDIAVAEADGYLEEIESSKNLDRILILKRVDFLQELYKNKVENFGAQDKITAYVSGQLRAIYELKNKVTENDHLLEIWQNNLLNVDTQLAIYDAFEKSSAEEIQQRIDVEEKRVTDILDRLPFDSAINGTMYNGAIKDIVSSRGILQTLYDLLTQKQEEEKNQAVGGILTSLLNKKQEEQEAALIEEKFSASDEVNATNVEEIIAEQRKARENNTKEGREARKERKERYSKFGANNKIITIEGKNKAIAQIKKNLGTLNSNMIHPEAMEGLVKLGLFVVEAGSRRFVEFVQDMYEQLKEAGFTNKQISKMSPYFKEVYMKAISDQKIIDIVRQQDKEENESKNGVLLLIDKFLQNVLQNVDPLSDESLKTENESLRKRQKNKEEKRGSAEEDRPHRSEETHTLGEGNNDPAETHPESEEEHPEKTEEELKKEAEKTAIEKHNQEAALDAQLLMELAKKDEENRKAEESLVVSVRPDQIDVVEGQLTIDGQKTDRETSSAMSAELELLLQADQYGSLMTGSQMQSSKEDKPKELGTHKRDAAKYLSQTFFYDPKAETNMDLRIGGHDIKLEHPLAPNNQLAKNLLIKGWFDNAKKYYVVTQSQEAANNPNDRDSFTVAMIIDDGKNSYAVTLRQLGVVESKGKDGKTYTKNYEFKWRMWLAKMGTQFENLSEDEFVAEMFKVEKGIAEELYDLKIESKPNTVVMTDGTETSESLKAKMAWKARASKWYTQAPTRDKFRSKEAYEQELENWKLAVKQIKELARKKAEKPNCSIITDDQIDAQIANLRELRNQIIDAVLSKNGDQYIFPSTDLNYPQNASPLFATKSNGVIESVREDGKPVFRHVLDGSIDEITKQIESGEAVFGIGLGYFSKTAPGEFKIRDLGDTGIEFKGKGLSGKIYLMVQGVDGQGNPQRIPIMLTESRFDRQEREVEEYGKKKTVSKYLKPAFVQKRLNESEKENERNSNVVLTIDPITNEYVGGKYKPSAAEVLLYLICGRTPSNDRFFGKTGNAELAGILSSMFINHGEMTLLHSKSREGKKKLAPFAQKQIAWYKKEGSNQYTFEIALPDDNDPNVYTVTNFSETDIFGNTDVAEKNRKIIVSAIATQMHWNTEENHMTAKFNDPQFEPLIKALKNYFTQYDESSISIFGCSLFTFNRDDFFDEDLDLKSNLSMLAWMIKTGRIITDTSKQIFKDPFVFANGVKQTTSSEELGDLRKKAGEKPGSPTVSVVDAVAEEVDKRVQNLKTVTSKFLLSKGDARKTTIDYYNTLQLSKANGGVKEVLAIDVTELKGKGRDLIFEKIKEKLNLYAKTNGITDIDWSDVQNEEGGPRIQVNEINAGKAYPIVYVYNNGTCKVSVLIAKGIAGKAITRGVTGVFSMVRGKGNLNEHKARKWLRKTLGLTGSNVIVENAIWKSTDDASIFGITNLCLDELGRTSAEIRLSTSAGRGVHFHEAWHYVNLLLNTEQDREILYEEYEKLHPELKGKEYELIEEAMAEDFRAYMEMRTSYTPSALIKRLWDNVKTLIGVSKNKTAYRYVYQQIRKGSYSNVKFDTNSLHEFARKYPDGVPFQGYIPGVPKKILDGMKTIDNYHEFYNTAYAVVNYIIDYFDITTIEQLRSISSKNFKDTLQQIKSFAETLTNPDNYQAIMDLYNNPLAFQRVLLQQFAKYGITVKIKSFDNKHNIKENDLNDEAHGLEDNPDNNYDRFELGISSKENVALRAKMFMSRIPILKPDYTEYEENGKKKRHIDWVEDLDDFLNPKMYSFSEVWVALSDKIHNTDSFDKTDNNGKYLPNSTLGLCEEASKANPMFISVMKKLKDVVDPEIFNIELKQCLLATINRSMPHIQYVQLLDSRAMRSMSEADMMMNVMFGAASSNNAYSKSADRDRIFDLFNDNRLHVARNIARKWSRNAMLKGLASNKEGKQVVDEQYVKGLLDILGYNINDGKMNTSNPVLDSLMWHINSVTPKKGTVLSETEKFEHLDQIKTKLIELLNYMGIDADEYSVNSLVNMHLNQSNQNVENQSADNLIAAYKLILRVTGSKKGGDIIQTIRLISESVGKEVLDTGEKDGKPIEDVYNRFGLDTEISKLAVSWNAAHPSSQEFSLPGPNGDMLYPVSQNNFISDMIRWTNNEEGKSNDKNASREDASMVTNLRRSDYAKHSIVLSLAKDFDQNTPEDDKIKLYALVGLKDLNNNKGADYFGITTLEDYLIKMCILESDHLTDAERKKISKGQRVDKIGQLILPTMADKKTYYSYGSRGLKLSHDAVINYIPGKYIESAKEALFYELELDKNIPNWDSLAEYQKGNIIYEWWQKAKDDRQAIDFVEDIAHKAFEREHGSLNRYSDDTLNRFVGYFEDELRSLISYYSPENIAKLVKNPGLHTENFHGKILKNGRLGFNGNGGKFRYFFDTILKTDINGRVYNMNQYMQYLWNLQNDIENSKVIKPGYVEGDLDKYIGTDVLGKNSDELDGFELIRQYLYEIRDTYFGGQRYVGGDRETLRTHINSTLIQLVDEELEKLYSNPALACVKKTNGHYSPHAIPKQFLQNYADDFERLGIAPSSKIYSADGWTEHNALYSLIANHMTNTITSMIEYEKIFSGDPAFNKWKGIRGDNSVMLIKDKHTLPDGTEIEYETFVDNVYDKFSDKIKRFGGQLSPGDEISLFYNKNEIDLDLKCKRPSYLNCTKYTNLNIEDLTAMSMFIEPIRKNFMIQTTVDFIRGGKISQFEDYVENRIKDAEKKNKKLNREHIISLLYSKDAEFKKVFSMLPQDILKQIKTIVKQQIDPYTHITVADAQVLIRPSLYRKIRIGLGEWSFEPDENGYCDEEAFNILENDDSWMNDPEKAIKVRKFQLYPLKMSYYQNNPSVVGTQSLNLPIYNKMAIFPVFKFNSTSEVARKVYDRMNMIGNELDMISFKSAVKIGAIDNASSPISTDTINEMCYTEVKAYGEDYESVRKTLKKYFLKKKGMSEKAAEVEAEKYTNSKIDESVRAYENSISSLLASIDDEILRESDTYIDYPSGEVKKRTSKNTQPVMIQDLKYLRMQLNTKAHEAEERAIGTQMFKIAFSNIIDDATYCEGKVDRLVRTGKLIKRDVMQCINSLTYLGAKDIMDEYYKYGRPDKGAIGKWIQRVVNNNGLGTSAEEIIANGGVIASLMSRKLFEQTVSSAVNRGVVNINTHGGTAILQSSFGFSGYGKTTVATLGSGVDFKGDAFSGSSYINYNNGEELKWDTENGSMEILLSLNFFKPVVPKEHQDTPERMRRWLIEHDVIKGIKEDGTASNPKPFGVGYRIPTQGMSSMFAFTVADVLPEQSGDVIVVPREFTAQTGSDFDVDKLFLATMAYKDGQLVSWRTNYDMEYIESVGEEYAFSLPKEQFDEKVYEYIRSKEFRSKYKYRVPHSESDINSMSDEELKLFYNHQFPEYIQNRLILNYIDIISDIKNYGMSRASIDTITDKIKKELLPHVLDQPVGYIHGFYELTPSFQAIKKQEFGTGKDGIGPFALNITHLALTQYTHLSMDYGDNVYEFGDLDKIYGEDNLSIAGWLSAMVNAHVDVAKDPYVFAINVNKETYNHANFLIRAGKGLSTFTFLAQPILKLYTAKVALSKSLYGSNVEGKTPEGGRSDINAKSILTQLITMYLDKLKQLYSNPEVLSALSADEKAFYLLTINYFSAKDKSKVEKPDFKTIKVFDSQEGIRAINGSKEGASAKDQYDSSMFLLYSMYAYTHINTYAQKLADLVHDSQIDTKKFGNNITSHLNFLNNHKVLTETETGWLITTDKEHTKEPGTALKRYFDELYLNDKLRKATKMTREMLEDWTFTATPEYRALYQTICTIMFGAETKPIKGEDGKVKEYKYVGYKPVKNDDIITAIGNGIDNTMRFKALLKHGYSMFKREGGLQQEPNSGMIDFTCGGDILNVLLKVKSLFYGDPNYDNLNIIERLFNKLADIKKNPDSYEGLVDEDNGEILNEVLKYFQPMPNNQYDPIGRITLLTSLMNMEQDKKSVLMSAMYELLTYQDEDIRELIRDVILYGYYSTYDQNTRDAFLDIVPYEFRKQYDLSLAKAIRQRHSSDAQLGEIVKKGGEFSMAQQYLSVIARNYWYDDNIVPRYFESQKTLNTLSPTGGEIHVGKLNIEGSKYMFPGAIVSSYVRPGGHTNPKFFKIRKGDTTVLYRNVGEINVGGKAKGTYNVYMAIPKAGLHQGHIKQFEMYADYSTPSIFEQNRLPELWAPENLLNKINAIVENSRKQFEDNSSKYEEGAPEISTQSLDMFGSSIPEIYKLNINDQFNTAMYYEVESMNTAIDGIVRLNGVNAKEDPVERSLRSADVVIEINSKDVPVKYPSAANKTAFAKFGDVSTIVDDVARASAKQLMPAESKKKVPSNLANLLQLIYSSGVTINITGTSDGISVSQNEIDEYINRQVAKLKEDMYDMGNDKESVDKAVKDYTEFLKRTARDNVLQQKVDDYVMNMLNMLLLGGVKIAQLNTSTYSDDFINLAVIRAAKLLEDYIVYKNATVYVKKSDFREGVTDELYDILRYGNEELDELEGNPERLAFIDKMNNVNLTYKQIYDAVLNAKDVVSQSAAVLDEKEQRLDNAKQLLQELIQASAEFSMASIFNSDAADFKAEAAAQKKDDKKDAQPLQAGFSFAGMHNADAFGAEAAASAAAIAKDAKKAIDDNKKQSDNC